MAAIVIHRGSGERYVLLGTGFGAYKSSRASVFGGNLFPHEEEGIMMMAAACDSSGTIFWFKTEELKVIEVDGMEIEAVFVRNGS